jgi:hypothetical protein
MMIAQESYRFQSDVRQVGGKSYILFVCLIALSISIIYVLPYLLRMWACLTLSFFL